MKVVGIELSFMAAAVVIGASIIAFAYQHGAVRQSAKKQPHGQAAAETSASSIGSAQTAVNIPSTSGKKPSKTAVLGATTQTANGLLTARTSSRNKQPASNDSGPARLIVSPAEVEINQTNVSAVIKIVASNGKAITLPEASSTKDVYFVYQDEHGGGYKRNDWVGGVLRSHPDGSGVSLIKFTAYDVDGVSYTGTLKVNWPPVRYFSAKQGALTKTHLNNGVTVFTTHFSIVPGPNFGTTTLFFRINSTYGCLGSIPNVNTVLYTGQPEFTLDCGLSDLQIQSSDIPASFDVAIDASDINWTFGSPRLTYYSVGMWH